jgi:hypothetical protein
MMSDGANPQIIGLRGELDRVEVADAERTVPGYRGRRARRNGAESTAYFDDGREGGE